MSVRRPAEQIVSLKEDFPQSIFHLVNKQQCCHFDKSKRKIFLGPLKNVMPLFVICDQNFRLLDNNVR
jgi:hypothetical protein